MPLGCSLRIGRIGIEDTIPHNDPQSRERCVDLGMNPMEERLELSFRLHVLWGLSDHVIGWARVAWRIVRQYLPHARRERQ